jgi:hypothetical protein
LTASVVSLVTLDTGTIATCEAAEGNL